MQPKSCLKTHKIQTHQHPNHNLACPQASPKLKSKLKDSKEVLAQVLLCLIVCTKSNPFLPYTHMGLCISKGVH